MFLYFWRNIIRHILYIDCYWKWKETWTGENSFWKSTNRKSITMCWNHFGFPRRVYQWTNQKTQIIIVATFSSVLPSPSPTRAVDSRPSFASTFPRSNPAKSSCACCIQINDEQPVFPNRSWQRNARSKSDDEIKICPPNFPTSKTVPEYKTCYDGDIQHYLNGANPELPLCLQNIILQHVQNAETFPDKSSDKKMKKKMSKFFVVPEDPSDPVAFTETFPDHKRTTSKGCCGAKPVHKIVGIFTFLMSAGILIIIICVYRTYF